MNGKFCGESLPKRGPVAGCKPVCQALRCSPGSCREEMRGRVIPRYRENECAGFAAKLGGTTEVLCLSSLSFGMKGIYFFPERIPLLIVNKEEAHGQKLVKGIHH